MAGSYPVMNTRWGSDMVVWRLAIMGVVGAMMLVSGGRAEPVAPSAEQSAPPAPPVTPEAFTAAALAEVQSLPEAQGRVTIAGPLSLAIDAGGAEQRTANLDRIYDYCQRIDAERCAATRHRFLQAMLERAGPYTADNLRIAVRSAAWVAQVRQALGSDADNQPLVRPVGDNLFALLVFDTPQQVAYVGHRAFEHLVMDDDALWAQGLSNTLAHLPPIATTAAQLGDSPAVRQKVYQFDEYGLTWLAVPERWATLAASVGPTLVVAPVSDNLLLVADARADEIAGLRAVAQHFCGQVDRCVSDTIYHLRDGQWVVAQ